MRRKAGNAVEGVCLPALNAATARKEYAIAEEGSKGDIGHLGSVVIMVIARIADGDGRGKIVFLIHQRDGNGLAVLGAAHIRNDGQGARDGLDRSVHHAVVFKMNAETRIRAGGI